MKLLCRFFFLALFLFSANVFAQSKRAMIINDGALVYVQPDFDAELLTELKAGGIYDISLKTKGPFYKIRIRPKVTGWIADTDVRVGKFKKSDAGKAGASKSGRRKAGVNKGSVRNAAPGSADEKAERAKEAAAFLPKKKLRPFDRTRFRGPVFSYLAYSEDTMGALRQQSMPFIGVKVEGPNTLMSGDIRTATEFIFHPGAPEYYGKLTGTNANGWIFITDFIFETALPQSPWHMVTYGFGPMFKYTHYEVTLQEAGRPVSYSLDDMALGAVFDLGLGFRLGSYALRFNGRYYWEKTKYWGGSLTFGFPF